MTHGNFGGKPDWDKLAAESLDAVKAYPVEFASKKMTVAEIRNRLYSDKETRGIELAIVDGFIDILRPGDRYNETGTEEYLSQQLTISPATHLEISPLTVLGLGLPAGLLFWRHFRNEGFAKQD